MGITIEPRNGPPSCRRVLQIRFVLLSRTPRLAYLSETLIAEAQWHRIASPQASVGHGCLSEPFLAKTSVTLRQIEDFLEIASDTAQSDCVRFRLPTEAELRSVARGLIVQRHSLLQGPVLYSGSPSPMGFYDLIGVAGQICASRGGHAHFGGSFRTSALHRQNGPPCVPIGPDYQADDVGLRVVMEVLHS